MKHLKFFLFLVSLVSASFVARSQVILMMPDVSTDNGEKITVDVSVAGFQNIISAQFGVTWDTTVLRYDTISNFAWELNVNSGFGGATNSGQLAFLWLTDDFDTGDSVADSSILFSIVFDVIGETGTSSYLQFRGPASTSPLEVADLTGVLDVTLTDGFVTVGTNAVERVDSQLFESVTCMPNPAYGDVAFSFSLLKGTDVRLIIYDSMGQLVFNENAFYGKGKQVISVSKDIFSCSGAYFYKLQSGSSVITQKFVFVAN